MNTSYHGFPNSLLRYPVSVVSVANIGKII